MAFSYSDKNFTVIGNLCFVHILLDGTKTSFDIPPAISDRIIYKQMAYIYPYIPKGETSGTVAGIADIGLFRIADGEIILSGVGTGYLSFCFPIDSNK